VHITIAPKPPPSDAGTADPAKLQPTAQP